MAFPKNLALGLLLLLTLVLLCYNPNSTIQNEKVKTNMDTSSLSTGFNYIGNPDYRGYLNYLSQNGDNQAKNLLGVVGNDGVLGVTGVISPQLENYNHQLYSQFQGFGNTGVSANSPYQQSLLDSLPGQLNTINSYATSAAQQGAGDYNTKVQDFLDQQRLQQAGVDTQNEQNELSKIYGNRGVLDMVGQGVRSGGVQLANRNAGSSSATEALARAYGILGRTQQTGINNQYQQGLLGVQNAQHALDVGRTAGVRDLTQNAQDTIGNIVQNANQQLSYLNSQLASASLPDQLNIQQQIDNIKAQATAALQPYTDQLNQGVAGISPLAQDQARVKAQQMSVAGTAPDSQFSYTSAIPAQFQNTGPFSSGLPIFVAPTGKKQTA